MKTIVKGSRSRLVRLAGSCGGCASNVYTVLALRTVKAVARGDVATSGLRLAGRLRAVSNWFQETLFSRRLALEGYIWGALGSTLVSCDHTSVRIQIFQQNKNNTNLFIYKKKTKLNTVMNTFIF